MARSVLLSYTHEGIDVVKHHELSVSIIQYLAWHQRGKEKRDRPKPDDERDDDVSFPAVVPDADVSVKSSGAANSASPATAAGAVVLISANQSSPGDNELEPPGRHLPLPQRHPLLS